MTSLALKELGLNGMHIPHVVVTAAGADLNPNAGRPPDINHCLEALQAESAAVLDRAAPFVGTLVGRRVKELMV